MRRFVLEALAIEGVEHRNTDWRDALDDERGRPFGAGALCEAPRHAAALVQLLAFRRRKHLEQVLAVDPAQLLERRNGEARYRPLAVVATHHGRSLAHGADADRTTLHVRVDEQVFA